MSDTKYQEMTWMDNIGQHKPELMQMFVDKFFDGCRKKKSAFKRGAYRASPKVAIQMVRWWNSMGVMVDLAQIRPDIYGPNDKGPKWY